MHIVVVFGSLFINIFLNFRYIFWRKKWEAKGFGFTLKKSENDFQLNNFIAGDPEGLEVFYGMTKFYLTVAIVFYVLLFKDHAE